jgi:hypothetical protein
MEHIVQPKTIEEVKALSDQAAFTIYLDILEEREQEPKFTLDMTDFGAKSRACLLELLKKEEPVSKKRKMDSIIEPTLPMDSTFDPPATEAEIMAMSDLDAHTCYVNLPEVTDDMVEDFNAVSWWNPANFGSKSRDLLLQRHRRLQKERPLAKKRKIEKDPAKEIPPAKKRKIEEIHPTKEIPKVDTPIKSVSWDKVLPIEAMKEVGKFTFSILDIKTNKTTEWEAKPQDLPQTLLMACRGDNHKLVQLNYVSLETKSTSMLMLPAKKRSKAVAPPKKAKKKPDYVCPSVWKLDFKKGQVVRFGKAKGQQTKAQILGVSKYSKSGKLISVKLLESRGVTKIKPIGTIFRVSPSLLTIINT